MFPASAPTSEAAASEATPGSGGALFTTSEGLLREFLPAASLRVPEASSRAVERAVIDGLEGGSSGPEGSLLRRRAARSSISADVEAEAVVVGTWADAAVHTRPVVVSMMSAPRAASERLRAIVEVPTGAPPASLLRRRSMVWYIWPPLSRFLTVPGGTQYTKVLVLNASYFLHFQWYQIYLTHMYLIGIIGSLVLMCQCANVLVHSYR